ncbi:MAG: exosortase/archaeosortase family protein [Verrucomicrobiota bacterium JB022]|nr:exosortase/archaeosortase family protein [Verrucomicrobiota bacterium JB022]
MADAGTKSMAGGRWWAGIALALGGFVLFQWWGNATRGYIDTGSVFVWWMSQWFNDGSDAEHGPLVLLLAGYLLYHNLQRWKALDLQPRVWRGGAWLVGAVVLNALGFFVQETRLNILGVLAWLQGMAWLLGGERWGRAARFPLLLMLFSIPLNFVQDFIGAHLRYAVIASVHGITELLGLEVERVGTVLMSPGRDYVYDVAPACSGIRSLLVVGVLSLVASYFTFQRNGRRALLLALALPFAFVGNLLRVLAIVLVGHFAGSEWGLRVHDYSGFVVFAVVLGLALLTAHLLEKFVPEKPVVERPAKTRQAARHFWLAPVTVLALAALSVAALEPLKRQDVDRLQVGLPLTPRGELEALPDVLPGPWLGYTLPMSEAERLVLPPDTGFARALYRSLHREQVLYTQVLSGLDRSSIHRPEICLRAQGWEIRQSEAQELGVTQGDVWPATVMLAAQPSREGEGVTYALLGYWFVSGRDEAGTHHARRLLDLRYRLQGEAHRWAYVLVQTPLSPEEAQLASNGGLPTEALLRLARVGASVRQAQAN